MNLLTVLVASSIINFQHPVQTTAAVENSVESETIEQIAIDYLKTRILDADFIQTAVVEKDNSSDIDVYLAFSADSTPVNTCMIHLHRHDHKKTQVEHISCVNYQKKIGFRENINSTIYH